jgi:hypothetical protein
MERRQMVILLSLTILFSDCRQALTNILVPSTHVLITAGPWTPAVFKSLFPQSTLKIPVSALAGHSLLVKSPRWSSIHEDNGCHAVFATDTLGFSPELFSRFGEEIYLAGLNSTTLPLPALASDAVAREVDVKQLKDVARGMLGGKEGGDDLVVLRESLVTAHELEEAYSR